MGAEGGRRVYMIGYGGLSLEELLDAVRPLPVRVVVDIRRWALSRRAPEYSWESLERVFQGLGLRYLHVPSLGGYRVFGREVVDRGWFRCFASEGFRAYATYLLTSREAWAGLETLWYNVDHGLLVLCRERHWWRCHRKIVADWLLLHGVRVLHVLAPGRLEEHRGTKCLGEMAERLRAMSGLRA